MAVFTDKHGDLDVRNAFAGFQLFKMGMDIAFIFMGPLLWFWHVFKVCVDIILLIGWGIGRLQHKHRKHRRRK